MFIFLLAMSIIVSCNWNKFNGEMYGWIAVGVLDAVIFCIFHFVTGCKIEFLKA